MNTLMPLHPHFRWLAGMLIFLAGPAHDTTLPPGEQEAVIAEIEAMVDTDESRVNAFVVTHATPDRIERLYRDPEF